MLERRELSFKRFEEETRKAFSAVNSVPVLSRVATTHENKLSKKFKSPTQRLAVRRKLQF